MVLEIKHVVMHPRAYIKPFLILVLAHHLPMILAYALLDRPSGIDECKPTKDLFRWFLISFVVHIALALILVLDMLITLCSTVHRQKHPEHYLLLFIFAVYVGNLVWTIYGETDFPSDTSACSNDSDALQDANDHITSWQHWDFILSVIAVAFGVFTSLLCGVHSSDDMEEAEEQWMRRCSCMYRAFTCQSEKSAKEQDEDMFIGLGRILRKALYVGDSSLQIDQLHPNDLKMCLELVEEAQSDERKKGLLEPARPVHFSRRMEQDRLREIAYFGRFAAGIYGWPVYVWYSPLRCFKVINCCARKHEEQVIDNDNIMQGNRASFISYTGIEEESLAYLNCYNFVFSAPYSIVKDNQRRELIITVRGSLSFYDYVTDALANSAAMDPDELPYDVPNPKATMAHYGMLRTARSLLADLQEGSRKTIFWDFAKAEAVHGWKVVVCGHSMGAGVSAILALLLRKEFPSTKAFLFAPPMVLDPKTAAYTRSFITTTVYGDDLVPRLSIQNVLRLQQEMIQHYDMIANQPVYRVQLARIRLASMSSMTTPPSSSNPSSTTTNYGSINNGSSPEASDAETVEVVTEVPQSQSQRPALEPVVEIPPPSTLEAVEEVPQSAEEDQDQTSEGDTKPAAMFNRDDELDVPGVIVHVETVHKARRCGCTMVLGKQELTYSLRDPSFFRRIWITPRAIKDHMVHHYDRDLRHLLECLGYSVAAHHDQVMVQVDPEEGGRLTEEHGEAALITEEDIGQWISSQHESRQQFAAMNQA